MAGVNDVNSLEYWQNKKRQANAVFNRPSSGAEQRQAYQVIRTADQQIRRLKMKPPPNDPPRS
jgi:hypothetical protein